MSAPDRPPGARSAACTLLAATALRPGAIAILQLIGDVEPVLWRLTGIESFPVAGVRLASLGGIDTGLVARPVRDVAQIMPHGGPRVVQRLIERLIDCGAVLFETVAPESMYPEAADRFEALAMAAVARSASPLAVDLLLDQPRRLREGAGFTADDLARSRRLNRLIDPPLVALAGPANVGKSTLSNTLMGRSMSIAADLPGTTRDYTSGRIELAGLVVDWHDTPGLRTVADPIEARAVDLARRLLARADFVIALADHEHDWPKLDRAADLRVAGKCDLGARDDAELAISATTGEGIADLVTTVRDRLVPPEDLEHPGPWLFDERLASEEP